MEEVRLFRVLVPHQVEISSFPCEYRPWLFNQHDSSFFELPVPLGGFLLRAICFRDDDMML